MYVCKGCGRKLAENCFYPHPKMASGHFSFCKDCVKAKARTYRSVNIERVRAYDRWRGDLPHRVAAYQASRPPTASARTKQGVGGAQP
jgi:hypothetical protein